MTFGTVGVTHISRTSNITPRHSDRTEVPQTPSAVWTRALLSRSKRLRRDSEHSPPPSTLVKCQPSSSCCGAQLRTDTKLPLSSSSGWWSLSAFLRDSSACSLYSSHPQTKYSLLQQSPLFYYQCSHRIIFIIMMVIIIIDIFINTCRFYFLLLSLSYTLVQIFSALLFHATLFVIQKPSLPQAY
jgi:hypothetical protein